jgi:hypothetical protein
LVHFGAVKNVRSSAPERGEHCQASEISAKAAQRREAAVGSGITALPFGKPFSAMALKIAANIEIWSCGWMTAAIATCQGLTPAASSALGFLFVGQLVSSLRRLLQRLPPLAALGGW